MQSGVELRSGNNENMPRKAERLGGLRSSGAGTAGLTRLFQQKSISIVFNVMSPQENL